VLPIDPPGHYAVARYSSVVQVLKRPDVFSSTVMAQADPTLLGADPPAHTRVRRIINPSFSPSRIAALEPRIRAIAAELIGRILLSGEGELIADLAVPLPARLIADILGIDHERYDVFKHWSDAVILRATGNPRAGEYDETPGDTAEFHRFFAGLARERRDGLMSTLAREQTLNTRELLNLGRLLLVAGNETTTNLIGNALLALLRHPPELERALADPALLPAVIEETLRYDAPVQLLRRRVTRDVELDGTMIPAGSIVVPLLGSANRDEEIFPNPDRFDPARRTRGHIAFGAGPHYCLGARLARLEANIALEAVLTQLRNLRLNDDQVARANSMQLRGLARLPVTFDPP
jgi:cytochrome P450